eukprot:GHUV01049930.1.p1 GENE.GHUV01049930.1~~GHUV01049930.1.p1  ORF type:complete len:161 (+),score=37.67 GHUV01049930.1:229-711(+)
MSQPRHLNIKLACSDVVCYFCCSQRNLFGLNQKLSALVELGQSDSLFRLQWVDPWIRGDPNRTSRTVSIMNTRTSAAAIHGKALDADPGSLADDEPAATGEERAGNVTLGRLVAGAEWRRPLAANWSGIAGDMYPCMVLVGIIILIVPSMHCLLPVHWSP